VGKVHRSGTAVAAKKANRRHGRNCRSAPAVPTGVSLRFGRRDMGKRDRWRAVADWDPVTEDVGDRAISVESYQVQLRATDASGDPVETQGQIESSNATGSDFTVHAGSAPVSFHRRELDASPDEIKKTLTGLTTGIAVSVNFYARELVGVGDPRLKFEIWNVTDSSSVTSKNETLTTQNPKLYVTRDFIPLVGKTYEARVSYVSGSGIGLLDHIQWHDKGDIAIWTRHTPGDTDPLIELFADIPRPKAWFYQTRVRALNRHAGARCWSAWSAWTTPTNPATGTIAGPPAPTGVTLVLDKVEGIRGAPWRAKVKWNETPWWVPPDGDAVEGADFYNVQLAVSNNGGTTTANIRRKTVEADPSETIANANFGWNIRGKRYYRGRVRAVQEGRLGAWSAWTAWASPGGAPAPVQNLTWSRPMPGLLVAKWDPPTDLTDADRYSVVVVMGASTVRDTGFTYSNRWTYHIPKADRGQPHKVRVKAIEDEIILDVDEDVPLGWDTPDESTQVESAAETNTETWATPEYEDASVTHTKLAAFPKCRVRMTSTKNLLDDAAQFVKFGTTDVDTDNFYPSTTDDLNAVETSAHQFTLPFTGQYLVTVAAVYVSNATGRRATQIFKNSVNIDQATAMAHGGAAMKTNATFWVDATATDVLSIKVLQASGAALDVTEVKAGLLYLGQT
jgi:hypothetical protein